MARDIEEFLRKAAERRAKQQGGGQKQPAPQKPRRVEPRRVEPIPEPIILDDIEIVEAKPVRRPVQHSLKPRRDEVQAQVDMRNQSVEEHVRTHLDPTRVTQSAERLGERIASVHDEVDHRVHEHLDHDISKVDDKPTITDDPSPAIFGASDKSTAIRLRKLLSNPQEVGNAIILSEILKRPDFD